MSDEEGLQRNIRHSTGLHALKKIGAIVDEETRDEAFKAQAVRNILLYGSIVLLLVATVLGYVMGVF